MFCVQLFSQALQKKIIKNSLMLYDLVSAIHIRLEDERLGLTSGKCFSMLR